MTIEHANLDIQFIPFSEEHLVLWQEWITRPHVKDVWFIEGYESSDEIHNKLAGNGYDYPYIIQVEHRSIGFIQSCDLAAYHRLCPKTAGLFIGANPGDWCMDLFIADTDYLYKGYGTEIVKRFVTKLFQAHDAQAVFIDPAADNLAAINCYRKAGFRDVRHAHDGITECLIMTITRQD